MNKPRSFFSFPAGHLLVRLQPPESLGAGDYGRAAELVVAAATAHPPAGRRTHPFPQTDASLDLPG